MGLGYDVYRRLNDGSPLWIAQVTGFREAENMLDQLVRTSPAEYFVQDAASGAIVLVARPETGLGGAPYDDARRRHSP